MSDPFSKGWVPIEDGTIVSVRCRDLFKDDEIRRGRICGWHICTGHDPDRRDPFEEPKPTLEYQVELLKTRSRYWVPAENLLGFLRGVPNTKR